MDMKRNEQQYAGEFTGKDASVRDINYYQRQIDAPPKYPPFPKHYSGISVTPPHIPPPANFYNAASGGLNKHTNPSNPNINNQLSNYPLSTNPLTNYPLSTNPLSSHLLSYNPLFSNPLYLNTINNPVNNSALNSSLNNNSVNNTSLNNVNNNLSNNISLNNNINQLNLNNTSLNKNINQLNLNNNINNLNNNPNNNLNNSAYNNQLINNTLNNISSNNLTNTLNTNIINNNLNNTTNINKNNSQPHSGATQPNITYTGSNVGQSLQSCALTTNIQTASCGAHLTHNSTHTPGTCAQYINTNPILGCDRNQSLLTNISSNIENSTATNMRTPHQFNELKVEDALQYLDLVKQKYLERPHIYLEFLQIMKKFKYKEIDTACVINSIKKLFVGTPELIAAFNSFIPQDYRAVGADNSQNSLQNSLQTTLLKKFSEHAQNITGGNLENQCAGYNIDANMRGFSQNLLINRDSAQNQNINNPQNVIYCYMKLFMSRTQSTNLPTRAQAQGYDNMARFGKDSENYQDFIALLHFCQTNQGVMNQVYIFSNLCTPESRDFHLHIYREMSRILQYDTDLLDDFMNFLPDFIFAPQPSQASDAENQNANKRKATNNTPEEPPSKIPPPVSHAESVETQTNASIPNTLPIVPEQTKPVEPIPRITTEEDIQTFVQSFISPRDKNRMIMNDSIVNFIIKNVDPRLQDHLLRVIALYASDTLSAFNLQSIIKTIFKKEPMLNEELVNMIFGQNIPMEPSHRYSKRSENINEIPLSSQMIDFRESNRIGHSYFKFRKDYIQPICSARTSLGNEVLNDLYISSQAVSGEDIPLSGSRKATAHINLVKTEQDRYDFDMMIHSNLNAIEYLENIQTEIVMKKRPSKIDLTVAPSSPFIQINCYNALQKLYGNHISLVLEGLKSACQETLKIVINALKVKQTALYNCSFSVNKNLSHEMSRYALKALDYQGSIFKSSEGKEIRNKCSLRDLDYDNTIDQEPPIIDFFVRHPEMYKEAHHFITYTVKKMNSINRHEKNKLILFLNSFHKWIFDIKYNIDSASDSTKNQDNTLPYFDKCLIYVNTSICVYIRLCNMLFDRMHKVHELFLKREDTSFYREIAHYKSNREINSCKYSQDWKDVYSTFETMIYNVIDGSIESDLYDEWCLCTFGLNGYQLYTIEKILVAMVRHLNNIPGRDSLAKYLESIPSFISNYTYDPLTRKIQNYIDFVNLWSEMFENDNCYAVEISKNTYENSIYITVTQVDIYKNSNESLESESYTDNLLVENKGKLIYEYILFKKMYNSNLILLRNLKNGIESRKQENIILNETETIDEIEYDPKLIYISYKLAVADPQNDQSDIITYRRGNHDIFYYRPYLKKAHEYVQSEIYQNKITKFKMKLNELYDKYNEEHNTYQNMIHEISDYIKHFPDNKPPDTENLDDYSTS